MANDLRIADLMARWESLVASGIEPTPAELSSDPALHAPLAAQIERRKRIRAVMGVHPTTFDVGGDRYLGFLPPPQAPGELARLGPFRILKLMGEGGMGYVLEAEEATLGRKVALKVLRPEMATRSESRERFAREARAAAAIVHDRVITIFHIGEDQDVLYLAMPLLKGMPLNIYMDAVAAAAGRQNAPLPIHEVLRIGQQIAEGLAAAHAVNLIHRDIKPGNIFLEQHSERSSSDRLRAPATLPDRPIADYRVKILDFGLALSQGDRQRLTETGSVVGTPAYMAPEQARGKGVDARADLFSLGAVLYELATGQIPFNGPDTLSILTSLAVDTPIDPLQLNPSLPAELRDLILMLLAKEPSRRPQTAQIVADTLAQLLLRLSPPSGATQIHPMQRTDPALAAIPPQRYEEPSGLSLDTFVWWLVAGIVVAAGFLFWPQISAKVRLLFPSEGAQSSQPVGPGQVPHP